MATIEKKKYEKKIQDKQEDEQSFTKCRLS